MSKQSEQRKLFQSVLTQTLVVLFKEPEYARAAARYSPDHFAAIITAGLLSGEASKDGAGVTETCRTLGIKPTYKAIRAYLTEGEVMA